MTTTKPAHWCERLACGHIVAVLTDGTMLLCTLDFGHKPPCSFHGTVPATQFFQPSRESSGDGNAG